MSTKILRILVLSAIACTSVVAAVGCFHSYYNDPDSCSQDPPVLCADPMRPNCVLGRCFADNDLPDGTVPIDFSGITFDAAVKCNGSNECPSDAPICMGGMCRACSGSGDDVECTLHDPGTPHCNVSKGNCVACLLSTDCGAAAPVCDVTHVCRKCAANSECATTHICKDNGQCALPSEVAVVDNTNTVAICSDTPMTGMPFCTISAGIGAGKPYVSVAASATAYPAFTAAASTLADLTVTVVGPGKSAASKATVSSASSAAVSVSSSLAHTTTLVLDGLDLIGSNGGTKKAGVACSPLMGTALVTVKDCSIHDSGAFGVDSNGCTLTVDSSLIGPNNGGGVKVTTTTYTMTNDIIFNSTAGNPGVAITDTASTGTMAFLTIANNGGGGGFEGGVNCPASGATKLIQDSIVYGNSSNAGTQFAGKCALMDVVTGTDNFAGATMTMPSLTSDYHLAAGGDNSCCIDKIMSPGTPNADHDVDLTMRPKGNAWDIGAHELK
jgi:hypothetical protein